MTPCVKLLKKHQKLYTMHHYKHESTCSSYGEEAAAKLGMEQGRVFKTLVVQTDKQVLAVGVVPVSSKLSLKAMAKVLDVKKVSMADAKDVQIATGYVLGGVSPLGQKKRLRTVIDESAKNYETLFVSAGKRGLEVELSPNDLQELTGGVFGSIQDN